MTTPPTQPLTFKARRAIAVGVLAVIVGVLLGAGICGQMGWATGQELTTAVGLAGIVWLVATILGVQVLIIGTGLSVDRLGPGILASSTARMMIALLIGVIVFFVLRPEGKSFWVTFLSAGLLALIAEATWAIRTINSSLARPTSGAPAKNGAV